MVKLLSVGFTVGKNAHPTTLRSGKIATSAMHSRNDNVFLGCLKVVGFMVCKAQPTTEDINSVGKSQPTEEYSTFKQPEKIIKKIKNNSLKNQ